MYYSYHFNKDLSYKSETISNLHVISDNVDSLYDRAATITSMFSKNNTNSCLDICKCSTPRHGLRLEVLNEFPNMILKYMNQGHCI